LELAIIKARFGFDGRIRTLREVGEDFGISKERARQIQEKAIIKIRGAFSSSVDFL